MTGAAKACSWAFVLVGKIPPPLVSFLEDTVVSTHICANTDTHTHTHIHTHTHTHRHRDTHTHTHSHRHTHTHTHRERERERERERHYTHISLLKVKHLVVDSK